MLGDGARERTMETVCQETSQEGTKSFLQARETKSIRKGKKDDRQRRCVLYSNHFRSRLRGDLRDQSPKRKIERKRKRATHERTSELNRKGKAPTTQPDWQRRTDHEMLRKQWPTPKRDTPQKRLPIRSGKRKVKRQYRTIRKRPIYRQRLCPGHLVPALHHRAPGRPCECGPG